MKSPRNYDTVTEAMKDLSLRGYSTSFSILPEKEKLVCEQTSIEISPEEFEIDEVYRFEGNTDPGDEMVVYAISSSVHQLKGILVDAFGMYSNTNTSNYIKHLSQHK